MDILVFEIVAAAVVMLIAFVMIAFMRRAMKRIDRISSKNIGLTDLMERH